MNDNNITKTKQKNKKAKYKVSTDTEHKCFIQMHICCEAMYHNVTDKSFSEKNPDHLPGIFYVRWKRMDDRHTFL
jgi:hypothetical protein